MYRPRVALFLSAEGATVAILPDLESARHTASDAGCDILRSMRLSDWRGIRTLYGELLEVWAALMRCPRERRIAIPSKPPINNRADWDDLHTGEREAVFWTPVCVRSPGGSQGSSCITTSNGGG